MSIAEPFDQLLREKILELEEHDAEQEALRNDPVERLRLAALRALATGNGRSLPWHGAGGYTEIQSDTMTDKAHKLDLLF
jgi:hypothetical protein